MQLQQVKIHFSTQIEDTFVSEERIDETLFKHGQNILTMEFLTI